jgi:SAM-dependent methyltransferase
MTFRVSKTWTRSGKEVPLVNGFRDYFVNPDLGLTWEDRSLSKLPSRQEAVHSMVASLRSARGGERISRLLEVGTGRGLDTRVLLAEGLDVVVSLDMHQTSLHPENHERYASHAQFHEEVSRRIDLPALTTNGRCLQLIESRAEAMPFPSRTFDAIIAKFTLEYIEGLDSALREMKRVARRGASLIIQVDTFQGLTGLERGGILDVPWAHLLLVPSELVGIVDLSLSDEFRRRLGRLHNKFDTHGWRTKVEEYGSILDTRREFSGVAQCIVDDCREICPLLLQYRRDDLLTTECQYLVTDL